MAVDTGRGDAEHCYTDPHQFLPLSLLSQPPFFGARQILLGRASRRKLSCPVRARHTDDGSGGVVEHGVEDDVGTRGIHDGIHEGDVGFPYISRDIPTRDGGDDEFGKKGRAARMAVEVREVPEEPPRAMTPSTSVLEQRFFRQAVAQEVMMDMTWERARVARSGGDED